MSAVGPESSQKCISAAQGGVMGLDCLQNGSCCPPGRSITMSKRRAQTGRATVSWQDQRTQVVKTTTDQRVCRPQQGEEQKGRRQVHGRPDLASNPLQCTMSTTLASSSHELIKPSPPESDESDINNRQRNSDWCN